ncbi:MAG: EamA family transporter [Alphaproteobacteria bacterium]|nr:EamA family transporter [Alphaproteobacteria bacterium]
MKSVSTFPLIIAGVLLNTIAQIALKMGMRSIGFFDFSFHNIIPIGLKVVKSPSILLGLSCYVLSVVVWLLALSRVDVSYAYPLTSLGYIFTAVLGFSLLGESLSLNRIIGIIVILIGVYFVSRS